MAENLLDVFTLRAQELYGTEATREFLRLLREEGRLATTRCRACRRLAYPPRAHCPHCRAREVEWVPIGEGATLHAFTTQSRALRFSKPDVIGLVDIPDLGRILSLVGAPYEACRIGMALRFEPHRIAEGLVVHRFVPA